jgi:hypothetical protein
MWHFPQDFAAHTKESAANVHLSAFASFRRAFIMLHALQRCQDVVLQLRLYLQLEFSMRLHTPLFLLEHSAKLTISFW